MAYMGFKDYQAYTEAMREAEQRERETMRKQDYAPHTAPGSRDCITYTHREPISREQLDQAMASIREWLRTPIGQEAMQ